MNTDPVPFLTTTTPQDGPREVRDPWLRHRWLGIGSLVAALAFGALVVTGFRVSTQVPSIARSRLTIATVERGDFVRTVTADGVVVATQSPTLYSPSPGTINLKVHAGDTVVEGQTVAVINSPDLTAKILQERATLEGFRNDLRRAQLDAGQKVRQLQANFRQAEVDKQTAEREVARSRKAYELGSYSELQVLRAQDQFEKAEFADQLARERYKSQPEQNRFDIESKRVLLERQQYLVADLARQIDGLNVRAPVNGQIGQVEIADRASVGRDTPLLTVVDLSTPEIEIKVPESSARELQPGMPVDIEGNRRRWQGSVDGVAPAVVGGQVTTRVRFTQDKPTGLRQNQRLLVRILIDRREDTLVVDRGSFIDQAGAAFAYVVHGDVAERRPVQLGEASLEKVEVLGGLSAGDRMVISGTEAFDGAARVVLSK